MTFPERASHQIAQDTNPLEPLNKEVKRRADVIGIFQNEASITPHKRRPCFSGKM